MPALRMSPGGGSVWTAGNLFSKKLSVSISATQGAKASPLRLYESSCVCLSDHVVHELTLPKTTTSGGRRVRHRCAMTRGPKSDFLVSIKQGNALMSLHVLFWHAAVWLPSSASSVSELEMLSCKKWNFKKSIVTYHELVPFPSLQCQASNRNCKDFTSFISLLSSDFANLVATGKCCALRFMRCDSSSWC